MLHLPVLEHVTELITSLIIEGRQVAGWKAGNLANFSPVPSQLAGHPDGLSPGNQAMPPRGPNGMDGS